MLIDPSPNPRFPISFQCTHCGHTFRRELHRIYVDRTTFYQRVIAKQETRYSEYIIPQRITCPKCQAVDQYLLTNAARSQLSMTMMAALMVGQLVADHPVKIIAFALPDGRLVHPLEGLEQARRQVETAPKDAAARLYYAHLLYALGYLSEAQAEYDRLVEQDPANLEAWYHLASILVAQKHKREARKALQQLVAQSKRMEHLGQEDATWLLDAQLFLEGGEPLDEMDAQGQFQEAPLREEKAQPKRKRRK